MRTAEAEGGGAVCDPRRAGRFDNVLRPWLHPPRRLFGPWVRPGATVLDVGCGRGWATVALARLAGPQGAVVAADLQPAMLSLTAARLREEGLEERVRLHRCEPGRVGVEGPVDFAVAFWMIHETPDPAAFFEEMRGLLAPGGRLFVAEPWFHVPAAAFRATMALAGRAGLRPVDRPRVFFARAAVLAPAEEAQPDG